MNPRPSCSCIHPPVKNLWAVNVSRTLLRYSGNRMPGKEGRQEAGRLTSVLAALPSPCRLGIDWDVVTVKSGVPTPDGFPNRFFAGQPVCRDVSDFSPSGTPCRGVVSGMVTASAVPAFIPIGYPLDTQSIPVRYPLCAITSWPARSWPSGFRLPCLNSPPKPLPSQPASPVTLAPPVPP